MIHTEYIFKLFRFLLICTNLGNETVFNINFCHQLISYLAPEHIGAHVGALLLGHGAACQRHLRHLETVVSS